MAAVASLTTSEEQRILQTTARLLAAAVTGTDAEVRDGELAGVADLPVLGAFVSLKRHGKLRSCCGFLGQSVTLSHAVTHAARRSAADDPRFPKVAARELPLLDVEVWLLHDLAPVSASGAARIGAVQIGRHGLQIARGQSRGLLLPGVAVEHGLSAEQFLEHVSMKAELPPTAWKEDDAQLWTFEGRAVRGSLAELLADQPIVSESPAAFSDRDLVGLAKFCCDNLRAMQAGATPNYFAPDIADGNVSGVVLTLCDECGNELLQADRISLKGTLPLQSTLFALTESLARTLPRVRLAAEHLRHVHARVTILGEPAMHGTAAEPDLRGVVPAEHLLLVSERGRTAGVLDPQKTAAELLQAAAEAAEVNSARQAAVYSLRAVTTSPRVRISHVPRATAGSAIRPAGVAGRFYPSDPQQLAELVERCFSGQSVQPHQWPAIMTPHAGLVYSGRVAAATLRRVRFPQTAIILGPKHTPHGVEWAVAPHDAWSIPGTTIPGDPALARQLVQAIPGLALDAAAHAQEHAVEVELPFIARLAPQTKVVGIALGAGDLAACRRFAAGLAAVIRSLKEPPLLVISSDMNHFASDAENRRLDEMALAAMESLDPERLYQTVTANHISMCGVLPAVIVMETLRLLGRLTRVERVAYATSGDVSGDRTRVVGYAGMLLGGEGQ
jgi:AmmeMemoRadiSam system protein B/AmmeMemoRadiSam system protein A